MLTMFTFTEAYTSERERRMTAKKGLFPTKVHIYSILINIFAFLAQLSKRGESEKLRSQLEAFKISSQMDAVRKKSGREDLARAYKSKKGIESLQLCIACKIHMHVRTQPMH